MDDGDGHEGEEHDVGHVAAGGELSRNDTMRAEIHDECADDAENRCRRQRHERLRRERGDDVIEQALCAGGEDVGLALFGVITLDDADSAKGFRETAGNFGVDLGPFAEDGSDGLEGALKDETEYDENSKAHDRHLHAELDEVAEGEEGGEDAAKEVNDTGADEIANPFDVGHDPGDESAGAVFVVKSYRKATDVGLHPHAQLSDETLALF